MKLTLALVLSLLTVFLAGCGGPEPIGADASVDARVSTDAAVDVAPVDAVDAGPGVAFALAPGEVAEVPVAAGVAAVRLAAPTGSERYVLIVASTELAMTGESDPYTAVARVDGFAPAPVLATGCSLDEARWRPMVLPTEAAPTGVAPTIGAERTFRIPTERVIDTMTARVVAVSERAVVWADVTPSHPATVDMAFVTELLRVFDATIVPRERAVFGMESDVDGDGRIALVFSPLTAQSGDAFFWPCDLVDKAGCGGSNRVEAVYLTPLDMLRAPYNTPAAVNEIVAHEVSHLVHYGRKVVRNRLTVWEDSVYMNEAFGGLAQDTIGFQLDSLRATKVALDQVNRFSLGEVLIDGTGYSFSRDAALRGGGYLFARWLYDRAGGDEVAADGSLTGRGGPALLRTLMDAPASVAATLRTSVGTASMADVAMDFYTALAASNREQDGGTAAVNGCFRYGAVTMDPVTMRPRGADLYSTFEGMMARGPAMQPIGMADGQLLEGGVEYLTVDATAGATEVGATVRMAATAGLRVRVLRVR